MADENEDDEFFLFKLDDKLKEIAKKGRDDMADNARAFVDLFTGGDDDGEEGKPKKLTDGEVAQAIKTAAEEDWLTPDQRTRCSATLDHYDEYLDGNKLMPGEERVTALDVIFEVLDLVLTHDRRDDDRLY